MARRSPRDNQKRGGFLTADDFAAHRADWVDPISTTYRGYELYELPPNTQGFVALEMLNILEGYDVASLGHNSADYLHRLAEAKRIAFADRGAFLADPALVPSSTLAALISKDYAATRRRDIDDVRVSAGVSPAVRRSTAATAATPSTSRPPTARATSSRSSTRCSPISAPAS